MRARPDTTAVKLLVALSDAMVFDLALGSGRVRAPTQEHVIMSPSRESRSAGLTLLTFASVACVANNPAAGTTPFECTDTDPPMTSGGTWGPPWQPPDFPVPPDIRLDLPSGPPPGDPDDWTFDGSTGTYYRGSTEDERELNKWVHHTILVIPPASPIVRMAEGEAAVELEIPLAAPPTERQEGLAFASLLLDLRAQHKNVPFTKIINSARGGGVVTEYPTMNFYLPDGLDWGTVDDTVVSVFASDKGAIELNGATYDRTFRLTGPFDVRGTSVWIEIAPPGRLTEFFLLQTAFKAPLSFIVTNGTGVPGGGASFLTLDERDVPFELTAAYDATPALAGQCSDGLDNDADGYADECDFSCLPHPDFQGTTISHVAEWEHTKDFALIGDARFCTRNADNDVWQTTLMGIGASAAQFLNWVEPPGAMGRVPPVRHTMAGCFVFDDVATAEACHESGNCPAGTIYPYEGVHNEWGESFGQNPGGYMAKHWSAVDAWMSQVPAADRRPVNMVVGVVDYYDINDVFQKLQGLAYFDNNNYLSFMGSAHVISPTMTTDPDLLIGIGRRVAHELGHEMGLGHDDVSQDGYQGFMYEFGGPGPFLEWDEPSIAVKTYEPLVYFTQEEVWTQLAVGDNSPRPPGFGFVGCEKDADCTAGHPTLSCQTGVGWCVQQ